VRKKTKPHKDLPNNWKTYVDLKVTDRESYLEIDIYFTKKFKGCGKRIGHLSIDKTEPEHFVSSIQIGDKYRGFGLGKMLYLEALDVMKNITTSSESSAFARRAWSSIMKERPFIMDWVTGDVTFFKNRYWMRKYLANNLDKNKRKVHFE